ncbi:MAG: hypothetical protein KC619_31375 [Myxococcales bacterium]|nr:hypothetical protein [Myxococcales bacterium]
MKAPFEVEIPFDVLVLSRRIDHLRLVERVAPRAARVSRVEDAEQMDAWLCGHPVICAVFVEGAPPRRAPALLLERLHTRWATFPMHLLLPAGATPPPSDPNVRSVSLDSDAAWQRERVVSAFVRETLDERIRWVAGLLTFAHGCGLTGATLDTFVAFAIRQVHRGALAAHLGVSETAVEKRVRALCEQMGCDRLSHVSQLLLTISHGHVPQAACAAIEARAEKRRTG